MEYDVDALVVGLGPAGLAVSTLAIKAGLKVCAIEKEHLGGVCGNVGCVPSKALLRMAKARAAFDRLADMELGSSPKPPVLDPFGKIDRILHRPGKDGESMFDGQHAGIMFRKGPARFADPHTIAVDGRRISARHIFLCTGTTAAVPDIPGLSGISPLTNENVFQLERIPQSLMVLGSGAVACEMAQAFARLGARVTMVYRGQGLLWREDREVTEILERCFEDEGMTLEKNADMQSFSADSPNSPVRLRLGSGRELVADKVLCALGRRFDPSELDLDKAGIDAGDKGIPVDEYLRTSQKHVFACGDVNGEEQFSHAASQQGQLAFLNSVLPESLKRDFRRYPGNWTMFTEPEVARGGASAAELDEAGTPYETVVTRYEDFGAAFAQGFTTGFLKAAVTPDGHILGITVVGKHAGEIVNEWTMAMQNGVTLPKIMLQQHSFPTMGVMSGTLAQNWVMENMERVGPESLFREF